MFCFNFLLSLDFPFEFGVRRRKNLWLYGLMQVIGVLGESEPPWRIWRGIGELYCTNNFLLLLIVNLFRNISYLLVYFYPLFPPLWPWNEWCLLVLCTAMLSFQNQVKHICTSHLPSPNLSWLFYHKIAPSM